MCAVCVSARLPLARWGAATPHPSRLPVWLGLFSSKLCKSVFLCVFPHCFLVYQKGIGPWSGNLAIVSEPTDSAPPSRPCLILWPSLEASRLALQHGLVRGAGGWPAPLCSPPATAFPSKALCWLLSLHCPRDSVNIPAPAGGALIIPILQARK